MSWHKVKVGEFLIRVKDLIPIEKDKEYNLVTIKLYHKGVQLRKRELGSNISADKMSRVKSGQFILSGIDARNGAFGIIPPELDGAVVTNDFWHFDIDERIVSKEYFLWLTSTPFFDDICNKASDGTTNRIRLQADRFYTQELFIPDIDNQHEVVEELKKQGNKIDSLKKEYSYQLTLLDSLNQAILQEAVQGKLTASWRSSHPELVEGNPELVEGTASASELLKRIKLDRVGFQPDPNDKNIGLKPTASSINRAGFKPRPIKELPPIKPEEIPFDIPEKWVWCRLGEICDVNPRNKVDDEIDAGFIPMPMVSQLFGVKPTYEIRKWGAIKTGFTHFANNDVVVAKITPCFENSKAGIISDLPNGIGAGTTELNVLRGNQFVLPEYIYAFVKRIDFLKNGERIMKGVAGQQRVPTEYFYNTLIPLPPLSEQKRIVAEIERQFAKTKQLKELVLANQVATEQLLKALLHQAFEIKENDLAKA